MHGKISQAFCRLERLKKSSEFKHVFKEGKRVSVSGAKLYFVRNEKSINRIGFAIPRGYGTSVERNYSKRLSREVYRTLKGCLRIGYDIVLLTYPGRDTFSQRSEQLTYLCEKAGLVSS